MAVGLVLSAIKQDFLQEQHESNLSIPHHGLKKDIKKFMSHAV